MTVDKSIHDPLLDIAAEMRTRSREIKEAFGGRPDGVENMLDIWAVRIEAIAKRERAPVGNEAALREALSDACYAMFNFLKTQSGGYEEMAIALDKAKAALSAPPRQCDIGTADEQCERYKATGETHHTLTLANALAWSQMPYAEEGGGNGML